MAITGIDYPGFLSTARKNLKEIESKMTSKAETLEDLRNTTGKVFKTADLEKLMEKYDPDAYAQYCKIAKNTAGALTQSGASFLSKWMDNVKQGLKDGTISSDGTKATTKTSGSTKSTAADEYLSYLRQKYSNVNITVADFSSDKQLKSYMFSCGGYNNIAISSNILEKMASDPAIAAKYEKVIADVPSLGEEFKKEIAAMGGELLACGTVIDKNGNVSYWGISRAKTVENPGTKYKEKVQKQLEEKRAKKKEQEKAEAKKAEREQVQERQQKLRIVNAESREELLEKIRSNETEEISAGTAEKLISGNGFKGARVDYSV